jgi:hypothetical protein
LPATPTRAQPTLTVVVAVRHRISPEELAPNLAWGGFGGGGTFEDCGDGIPNIVFTTYAGSVDPPIPETGDRIAIGEKATVHGCDFQGFDSIAVTYRLPDGNVEQAEHQADKFGDWSSEWISVPGEPTGRYEVDVVSGSGALTGDFTVSETVKPTLLAICLPDEKDGTVVLTGFQPDEEVLIARYNDPMSLDRNLLDYGYITVEHNGTSIFQISREDTLIIAIGQETQYTRFGGVDNNVKLQVSAFDYCH